MAVSRSPETQGLWELHLGDELLLQHLPQPGPKEARLQLQLPLQLNQEEHLLLAACNLTRLLPGPVAVFLCRSLCTIEVAVKL